MREKLLEMLQKENTIIGFYEAQVTIDPPLTVARIRAELLRELLQSLDQPASRQPHSSETIQTWLVRIIGHEGGYWDDPAGGPTKWGISQRSYPDLDIAGLTVQDAEAIYRRDYLAPLRADRFDDGLAYQLLDWAVNSGMTKAVKVLQKILGLVPDGVIGPKTLATLAGKSESDLAMIVIAARLKYMASLNNWPENSRGWTNRMATNLLYAVDDTE